jgi:formiminoglutamase
MPDDPNWPRASAWLAGDHLADAGRKLAVLGAPVRLGSISGGRFDLAPDAIREALGRYSTWAYEVDVRSIIAEDLGDLSLSESRPGEAFEALSTAVRTASSRHDAVAILGGDNSVTRPGVHGIGPALDGVGVVTIDAHFDLRDTEGGLNNGNPIRALLEDGLPGRNVCQVGIQPFANSPRYAAVASESGIRKISTIEDVQVLGLDEEVWSALCLLEPDVDAIYVDVDLDVLDRIFAPAAPGSRPGGATPDDLHSALRDVGRHPKVRAIDLVEVDPRQDLADVTVLTAASCLLSFAAGLAGRGPASP